MCFVWISEQTAIISLYSINWLVFIAETERVYCAVRTESLTIMHVNYHVQMVSRPISAAVNVTEKVYGLYSVACALKFLRSEEYTGQRITRKLVPRCSQKRM
jgi:hypothetical protein